MTASAGECGAKARPSQRHGLGIRAIGAIEEAGEFGPAGLDEAADAEHLPAMDTGMTRETPNASTRPA